MIWALRDCIDKFKFARHNNSELVTEKYLRDILRILNKVSFVLILISSFLYSTDFLLSIRTSCRAFVEILKQT